MRTAASDKLTRVSEIQTSSRTAAYGLHTTEPAALRIYRHFRGLSQGELASRCGLAEATISRLERRRNIPSLNTATRIAAALDLPIELVFSSTELRAHEVNQ
jgi:DNA-binding XRE family transcriptional regulator